MVIGSVHRSNNVIHFGSVFGGFMKKAAFSALNEEVPADEKERKQLRQELREGSVAGANRDLKLAEAWFDLEEEVYAATPSV